MLVHLRVAAIITDVAVEINVLILLCSDLAVGELAVANAAGVRVDGNLFVCHDYFFRQHRRRERGGQGFCEKNFLLRKMDAGKLFSQKPKGLTFTAPIGRH